MTSMNRGYSRDRLPQFLLAGSSVRYKFKECLASGGVGMVVRFPGSPGDFALGELARDILMGAKKLNLSLAN